MTPDEAKRDVITQRNQGNTWTDIARWLEDEYGLSVHRTTVQRWYDKELEDGGLLDNADPQIVLEKKLHNQKEETKHYKKLYSELLKEKNLKDLVLGYVKKFTPAFDEVPQVKQPVPPSSPFRGEQPQIVVAPLTDTHIGEHVDEKQMAGLNKYDFEIFNKRLHGSS